MDTTCKKESACPSMVVRERLDGARTGQSNASLHCWPNMLHDGFESDSMRTYECGVLMPHCGHVISIDLVTKGALLLW